MKEQATRRPDPQHKRLSTRRANSFWPSASQEVLLRMALQKPPKLRETVAQWESTASLSRVDYPSLSLLPLVYRNLCRHDLAKTLRNELKGVYRWSWHRNQLLFAALQSPLAALRAGGIEPLMLKGVPLSINIYGDSGARVMGDADIAVRQSELQRSLTALQSLGWFPERPVTPDLVASLGGVNVRNEAGFTIDLHWHILPDSYDTRLDDLLFEDAEQLRIGSEMVRCLNPTDHLLVVISHGLSWAANSPVHWVPDAVNLMRAEHNRIDWEGLYERAARTRRLLIIREGLRYLVSLIDEVVPERALKLFSSGRVDSSERLGFWFSQRSDSAWLWGRAPLVLASWLRARRAQREKSEEGLGPFQFLSARAGCSTLEWLERAGSDGVLHLRQHFRLNSRTKRTAEGEAR